MRVLVTGGSGFIGTNLVDFLIAQGSDVLSTDVKAPRQPQHAEVFQELDVLDAGAVRSLVAKVEPEVVFHLAARTDLNGTSVDEYQVNTRGTSNVAEAISVLGSRTRLVFVSSMLVCRNGYVPEHDTDYCPPNPYGESKVLAETSVRRELDDWVICRPTSIWGPWFGSPYRDFFDAVRAGRYVHPGRIPVTKAFGYVANVVRQIGAAADAPSRSTHYVSDPHTYSVREFADEVAAAAGNRVRSVPVAVLRLVGLAGDLAQRSRLASNPPMTSFRLGNMLTPSGFDTTTIESLASRRYGPEVTGLREGVRTTLRWIEDSEGG